MRDSLYPNIPPHVTSAYIYLETSTTKNDAHLSTEPYTAQPKIPFFFSITLLPSLLPSLTLPSPFPRSIPLHPLPRRLPKRLPIPLVLLRHARLDCIVRIRLDQEAPRHRQHGRDPVRRLPLVRPDDAETHRAAVVVAHVRMVDFRLEVEHRRLERVVFRKRHEELEASALCKCASRSDMKSKSRPVSLGIALLFLKRKKKRECVCSYVSVYKREREREVERLSASQIMKSYTQHTPTAPARQSQSPTRECSTGRPAAPSSRPAGHG